MAKKTGKPTDEIKALRQIVKAGARGITRKSLRVLLSIPPRNVIKLKKTLENLESQGKIIYFREKYFDVSAIGAFPGEVTRCSKGFCFAESGGTEYFVPGRFSMGSMPGDKVLLLQIKDSEYGQSREAKIVSVCSAGPSTFTGVIIKDHGVYYVLPDNLSNDPVPVEPGKEMRAKVGDKVIAEVLVRGKRHYEHLCGVVSAFGAATTAKACSDAIIEASGVPLDFPAAVKDEAIRASTRGIEPGDFDGRLDLREEIIFTIDSAESKDLDDAISIEKQGENFRLGVHIADVSHYVKGNTALDDEAFARGTSIYYADSVIPMLPKELSNGICSLNPGEDRLAFSVFVLLGVMGEIKEYSFHKSIIRSKVKGIYEEINTLFDESANEEVRAKYKDILPSLTLMRELSGILTAKVDRRGAPQLETTESKILCDDEGKAVLILPRVQGESEQMIENFMLTANEAAASLAKEKGLPFIYRVHEPPSGEKITELKRVLNALGIDCHSIAEGTNPKELAEVIKRAKGTPVFPIVNKNVLRSMSKAKYSGDPIGHYGLVLKDYTHFTSPIRRYPDLVIHRILGAFLKGENEKVLHKKFDKYVREAAVQSTGTEITSMHIERECEDAYKAEYMTARIGEAFDAVVSGVTARGIYVSLENTVEGLLKIEELPDGEYEYDGMMCLKNITSGQSFRVGDKIRVVCAAANVNEGNVDFVLQEKDGNK